MSQIEAFAASRNLIDSAFSHLTWFEKICDQTGFKGVSQVWKEEPAWYFWMKQVKGAFLLRLHADEPLGDNHYLSFSLHYFPRDNEPAYQLLSAEEVSFLVDDKLLHQETNTPHFEAYELSVNKFLCAEIGCVIDQENILQALVYSSSHGEEHPGYHFIDLLIMSLNFQSKQVHRHAYFLNNGENKSIFLSYSEQGFRQFLSTFNLENTINEAVISNSRLELWSTAALLDAVCSANGTCSCSH